MGVYCTLNDISAQRYSSSKTVKKKKNDLQGCYNYFLYKNKVIIYIWLNFLDGSNYQYLHSSTLIRTVLKDSQILQ